jgi:hypothetical protein
MKCLSACFTAAIATLMVLTFLAVGGAGVAPIDNALQEQVDLNTAISAEVRQDADVVFSGVIPSSAGERFLTLDATSAEQSGWVILPYPNRGNHYIGNFVSDLRIRRVAGAGQDKLEMAPAIYQFSLDGSEENSNLRRRGAAARFSF